MSSPSALGEWFEKEFSDFKDNARLSLAEVKAGIHRASWRDILLITTGIVLSICGGGGQILSINFFISHFPNFPDGKPVGGPYVVLLSAGLSSLVLYIVVYVIWQLRYKSGFAWLRCKHVWRNCFLAGFLLSLNGFLATYATPHTAEVVQAMLIASQIVWTLLFAIIFKINQGKNYCHVLVISALVLSVGGIIVGTLATSAIPGTGNGDTPTDKVLWAIVYGLGIVPASLINVIAARFFQTCTYDEEELKKELAEAAKTKKCKDECRHQREEYQRRCAQQHEREEEEEAEEKEINQESPFITPEEREDAENDQNVLIEENNRRKQKTKSTLSAISNRNNSLLDDVSVRSVGANAVNCDDGSPGSGAIKNSNGEDEGDEDSDPNDISKRTDHLLEVGHGRVLFLLLTTIFQVICIIVLMPADFLYWFGPNAGNSAATISQLNSGFRCVFDTLDLSASPAPSSFGNTTTTSCPSSTFTTFPSSSTTTTTTTSTMFPNSSSPAAVTIPTSAPTSSSSSCASNLEYFLAFAICFALTNAGNVIVNQFSAPLTSMVAQVASPLTAIVLEARPSLSPNPTQSNVAMATAGVIMIIAGAVLFSFWEEMTSERKHELDDLVHNSSNENAIKQINIEEDDGNDDDDINGSGKIKGSYLFDAQKTKGGSNLSVPPPSAIDDLYVDQPAGENFASMHPESFTPKNSNSSNKKSF